LRFEMPEERAIEALNRWAGQPLPISASAWHDGELHLRLSGAAPAVRAAAEKLGGERTEGEAFWTSIREQTAPFFGGPEPLWRIAVPPPTAPLGLGGNQLIEWGGGLRWLRSDASPHIVREAAQRAKGHATLFRAAAKPAAAFAPLDPVLMRVHRELKAAFDPAGIFNPGRLYAEM